MLEIYSRFVDAVNERIGRALAWSLPAMTVVTLIVVFCGSVLRVGWVWMSEIVVYLHALLFMLAGAYTLLHEEHVRVDVLYRKLSPRRQAWVNLLSVMLLLLPVCAVIVGYSYSYVADSWITLERSSEQQGLPLVFLLKTCLLIAPVLMAAQGLSLAAKCYLYLRQNR